MSIDPRRRKKIIKKYLCETKSKHCTIFLELIVKKLISEMSNSNYDRVFINFNAPDAFQLCRKILGDNNANFNYIFQETKAKCNLRGRGSGYIELNGIESNENLHIHIEFADYKTRGEAKTLAQNLIETVQSDLQTFMQQQQQQQQMQQQNLGQQLIQQTVVVLKYL